MARTAQQMTIMEDTSWERLISSEVSKALVVVRPFFAWPLAIIAAAVVRGLWPANVAVVVFFAVAGCGLAALAWHLTRRRDLTGRIHPAATAVVLTLWLCLADAAGWTRLTMFCAVAVLPLMCGTWAMRGKIRAHPDGDADHLARVFATVADTAGLGGSRLRIKAQSPRKVEATILLPPGEKTADDAIRKAPYIESGLRFPPGSLSIAPNLDRADHAILRISDPRVMRSPVPWEGPSRPGESIAAPVRTGLWQDCEPAEWPVPGAHLLISGMTGAGKSLGAAWSYLAEVVTRADVAVYAIDITKGDQTLGPLRPALHRLETTDDGARALLTSLQSAIKPRTNYLAAKGLQRWREGCGLTYLVCWIEEAPDVFDAIGDTGTEKWLKALKAARSAGMSYVISLQRPDWTQMPTLGRSQMGRWTFGVADGAEAAMALSDVQSDRNCRPELWGARQPGMCFLDAPGIPDDRVSMPMRCFFWGDDDTAIGACAARWPASGRPLDELTAAHITPAAAGHGDDSGGQDGQDEEEDPGAVAAEYLPDDDHQEEDDDMPDIDDPISYDKDSDFGRWKFTEDPPKEPLGPEEARAYVRQWLRERAAAGHRKLVITDLVPVRAEVGRSRTWIYGMLAELEADGLIERDEDEASAWHIRSAA